MVMDNLVEIVAKVSQHITVMVEFKNGHASLDVEAINLQVHLDKTI